MASQKSINNVNQLIFYIPAYYIHHTFHVALYLYTPFDTSGLYCRYQDVHHRCYTNYHQTNRYIPHLLYEMKLIQEFYLYSCNKYRILYRQTLHNRKRFIIGRIVRLQLL